MTPDFRLTQNVMSCKSFLQLFILIICYLRFGCTENVQESNFTGGALKFCTQNEEGFEVLTKSCSKGVFLKSPVKPGCICFQGMWILHSTLCDETPYIFYGENINESCYKIDFNVSLFLFLGNPSDIRADKYFVSPFSMTVFTEIPKTATTKLLNYYLPTIISLTPSKASNTSVKKDSVIYASVNGKSRKECFASREYIPPKMQTKVVGHIWTNGFGPAIYDTHGSCEKNTHLGAFDDIILQYPDYYYRSTSRVPLPVPKCDFQCKSKESNKASASTAEDASEIIRSRKKRYKLRDTVNTIWNGLGYCMQSYWDPLLKFDMLTEEEKRCYPENQ